MATITDIVEGRGICICAGSGGVGKTTTSAALAAGLAIRGKKVAVLTIDPAKRLADSLGLE
ncbi:MAG TPA: ArsA-related P-loop ATPase, partial [Solirubrobacterales bacterium]|nr:ArsA-related P-loop ATPase [Solirubrobacterales bacterium]